MSRFVERAVAAAGLAGVLAARREGDVAAARALLAAAAEAAGAPVDLLVLGALADAVRAAEAGDVVRVHERACAEVTWVRGAASELELLRGVAMARLTATASARVGVDWGSAGLELAQVALGFGATDLVGPIAKKSGLLIHEDDLRKVKGQGMVPLAALKRREIAALIKNAGRVCEMVGEEPGVGSSDSREQAHA